jgi:hypothetical protein
MGVEPITPTLQGSVAPNGMPARLLSERSVRESNPVSVLTTDVCCRNTYRPFLSSDPGRNRTNGLLVQSQASLPTATVPHRFVHLCSTTLTLTHGSLKAAGVGIEPTPPGSKPGITTSSDYPAASRVLCGSRTRLASDLRANESRAGGNRTHTVRIKSPLCCLLHHDPVTGRVYAFQSRVEHRSTPSLLSSVVALRIELSAAVLSEPLGRPALDYHANWAPQNRAPNL